MAHMSDIRHNRIGKVRNFELGPLRRHQHLQTRTRLKENQREAMRTCLEMTWDPQIWWFVFLSVPSRRSQTQHQAMLSQATGTVLNQVPMALIKKYNLRNLEFRASKPATRGYQLEKAKDDTRCFGPFWPWSSSPRGSAERSSGMGDRSTVETSDGLVTGREGGREREGEGGRREGGGREGREGGEGGREAAGQWEKIKLQKQMIQNKKKENHRERQRDGKTDRQTDRQTERKKERKKETIKERNKERKKERMKERKK